MTESDPNAQVQVQPVSLPEVSVPSVAVPTPTDEPVIPPPPPEPPKPPVDPYYSLIPRAYMPRAFGFSMHGLFIEATLYKDPRDPRLANADGRFIVDDDNDKTIDHVDTYFETIDDLAAKAKWTPSQLEAFVGRMTKLMQSR